MKRKEACPLVSDSTATREFVLSQSFSIMKMPRGKRSRGRHHGKGYESETLGMCSELQAESLSLNIIIMFMQVRERCRKEWGIFQTRMAEAEKMYYEMMGVTPPNVTFVS
jgi:hypothetical protein